MNIVYFDAVNDPAAGESLETQVNRFMVAQAIMLSLAGVPGIYFHSLFGSRNDREAALQSGINRRINRQKLTLAELEADLAEKRGRCGPACSDGIAFCSKPAGVMRPSIRTRSSECSRETVASSPCCAPPRRAVIGCSACTTSRMRA